VESHAIMMHIAVKEAFKSTFKQRIGAVVEKNGRILSTAHNSVRYKRGRFLKKWKNSLHAEQAALLALSPRDRKRSSLHVARVLKNGELANACPCPVCREMIITCGVKEVFYTNENGDVVRWKL
jgi:deoxycytidylate deaminase